MKKFILLFTLITLVLNCSNDDVSSIEIGSLFIGDAILTTQEEVNTFAAQEYSGIVGSLLLGISNEASNITDISGLNTLDYISFSIVIQNTNLNSLNGLENINRELESEIFIDNNPLLENINGLRNIPANEDLRTITISNNPNLISLSGLENIIRIQFGLRIINNSMLTSLEGLNNIISSNSTAINDNQSLVSLSGLDQLISSRTLGISNNDNLESLNGLQNLESLDVALNVTGNDSLNDLRALSNLTSRVRICTISGNNTLTNLNGLENIKAFGEFGLDGGLIIEDNINLSDFCAISDIPIEVDNPNSTLTPFRISGNAFNPNALTLQNTIGDNCSL